MSFADVIFLLGAIGVVGPLLAHLLARPRYRKVLFTMLDFLQIGKKDVQARRKLRNLLLLLLRCAIIVVLAMLFAGPRIARALEAHPTKHAYYIGLDNSISMTYDDGGGSYWQRALVAAEGIIRSAEDDAAFNVNALASGDWGRNLAKPAALAWLARARTVPLEAKSADFVAQIKNARSHRASDVKVSAAILSDFTPAFLDDLAAIDEPAAADSVRSVLLAADGAVKNSSIVRANVARAARKGLELGVTVRNYGPEPAKRTLAAKVRDVTAAQAELELPANGERGVTIEVPVAALPAGEACVPIEISLSGGDGLAADDKFCLSVWLPEQRETNVCIVGPGPRETFLLKTAIDALSRASAFETIRVTEMSYGAFEPAALKKANIAFFAGVPGALAENAPAVASFVREGGKAVFFLSEDSSASVLDRLWQSGALPALPRQYKAVEARIEAVASGAGALAESGADATVVPALQGYGMDKILLTGFHECEASPDGAVLWRLKNGTGFLFARRLGNGSAFLVNTSADDSMGALTKSPAAVAFCRFFVGQSAAPVCRSFTCGERVMLPAVESELEAARKGDPVWVMKPSGDSVEATVADALVVAKCADEAGWVATMAKPTRYAGVNLPEGETDVTKPAEQVVAAMTAKALQAAPLEKTHVAPAPGGREYLPIWRYFAWALVALIFLEAFAANRTQR